ncbi:MAG: FAD-binding oxidoreductase [Solirubrobacteraceae bacterium]
MSGTARRKIWGWGLEGEGYSSARTHELGESLGRKFGIAPKVRRAATLDEIELRAPRAAAPASLSTLCTDDRYERVVHSYGKSNRDLERAFRGEFPHPPDLVAYPRDEQDVQTLLNWCSEEAIAVIPFGAGSSVVGGVEPLVGDEYSGTLSLDLKLLDKVISVDQDSRAAHIEGGIYGPALEARLKTHGLTLRHFPQSFQYSTLGGWIATRSGGHYATLYTHIDEFVEGLRVATPAGVFETRRLPGSGAGPSPERLYCGSEGVLGIITSAWMRLQERPSSRAKMAFVYGRLSEAAAAARDLAQSGLFPTNCRLLDPQEAELSGVGDGTETVLIVAFESADHDVTPWMIRAEEIARSHGGIKSEAGDDPRPERVGQWRERFIDLPHRHDALVELGMVSGSFETAITWNRFEEFHEGVGRAIRESANEICGACTVSCRFAYVYPDGPAPYYTVVAPGTPGQELYQYDAIKEAASDAIMRLGGTITHHHAVGRDHRPWYDIERPDLYGAMLREAKRAVDPAGILNPGVVVDPVPVASPQTVAAA